MVSIKNYAVDEIMMKFAENLTEIEIKPDLTNKAGQCADLLAELLQSGYDFTDVEKTAMMDAMRACEVMSEGQEANDTCESCVCDPCACDADDEPKQDCVMAKTPLVAEFAAEHMSKLADVLDNRGFEKIADIIDEAIHKLSKKK